MFSLPNAIILSKSVSLKYTRILQQKFVSVFGARCRCFGTGLLLQSTFELENGGKMEEGSTAEKVLFPAEWSPHKLTFMAWPNTAIWDTSREYLSAVRGDVAGIAKAIAKYEPLVMLTSPDQVPEVRQLLTFPNIEVLPMVVDDLWVRDTVPAFTLQGNSTRGVELNFNGWGNKQEHKRDTEVASNVLQAYNLSRVKTWLVTEGGALETDGAGTLLVTKSSLVNPNRNPGRSQSEIEAELKRVLGVKKVIWLEGVVGKDITDAHVDLLARFIRPGLVLLNRPHKNTTPDDWSRSADQALAVLKTSTDAGGSPLQVIEVHEPDPEKISVMGGKPESFAKSYANYYVVNGAVIIPRFGDEVPDRTAHDIFKEHFPGRDIVPVSVSALGTGGGGVHCATHELPLPSTSQVGN